MCRLFNMSRSEYYLWNNLSENKAKAGNLLNQNFKVETPNSVQIPYRLLMLVILVHMRVGKDICIKEIAVICV